MGSDNQKYIDELKERIQNEKHDFDKFVEECNSFTKVIYKSFADSHMLKDSIVVFDNKIKEGATAEMALYHAVMYEQACLMYANKN